MDDHNLIAKTAEFVKQKMEGEGTGHDWWHVYRVWQNAKAIVEDEKSADRLVVELGALLHDIADWKFTDGDFEAGPKIAREWLSKHPMEENKIAQVEYIVRSISFKGANVDLGLESLEAKIVSDADKLDAIGAIGIARAFAYGGSKDRPLYDPNVKPVLHKSFEAYKSGGTHTINHFYEKLLLLKDKMYTQTGKAMARRRHAYIEKFLDEFYAEWDGEA